MAVREFLRKHWAVLAIALVCALVLLGLAGTCAQEPSVNEDLARSVRVAVESADVARRENDASYIWPGRLRLAVIAVGVSVPIVAAVVLTYLVTRRRPEDLELLTQLARHGLILPGRSDPQLGSSDSPPELMAGEPLPDQHRPADDTRLPIAGPTDVDKPD